MASGKTFNLGKGLGAGARDKEAGVKAYAGEKPPPGAYVVDVKRLFVGENRGGPTIEFLLEINDPRPEMKKYAGYPIWGRQNITDKGIGYVNQLLVALGDGDKYLDGFHDSGKIKTRIEESNSGKQVAHVVAFGDERLPSPSPDTGIKIVVTTKDHKWQGKVSLEPTGYVPISESVLGESGVGDSDDEDAIIDDDESVNEDEDLDESENEDEDEEYEEDEDLFDEEDDDEDD